MDKRDTVKKIKVGGVEIGGGAPVSVQTMCSTKTWDVDATVSQIKAMQTAGADIVRIAIPDMRAAKAIAAIKEQVSVPLVADIHFDYRLALEAAARLAPPAGRAVRVGMLACSRLRERHSKTLEVSDVIPRKQVGLSYPVVLFRLRKALADVRKRFLEFT